MTGPGRATASAALSPASAASSSSSAGAAASSPRSGSTARASCTSGRPSVQPAPSAVRSTKPSSDSVARSRAAVATGRAQARASAAVDAPRGPADALAPTARTSAAARARDCARGNPGACLRAPGGPDSIAASMMSEVDHNVIEEGARMLIDCDIHVGYETVLDLAPYLDPATREVVVNCGTNGLGMPSYPWYHPTGWLRTDAFDRASAAVGSQLVGQTLDRVRAKVLDPLDLSYGILTPDEAAAFSILPNGILAAPLASAYNDWLLEHWLKPEPRLRGLIVIPAQPPEAAAAEIRRVGERDEFVGVFLPGGARIPYGSPVHDLIWRACDDLGLPVAVHTHFEGVGIAGPVTAARYSGHYREEHPPLRAGVHRHLASILCHGIL